MVELPLGFLLGRLLLCRGLLSLLHQVFERLLGDHEALAEPQRRQLASARHVICQGTADAQELGSLVYCDSESLYLHCIASSVDIELGFVYTSTYVLIC